MNQQTQTIFDRSLMRLRRNRSACRNEESNFLCDLVAAEIAERLTLIKREFGMCVCHNGHGYTLARGLAAGGQVGWIASSDAAEETLKGTERAAAVFDEEALPIRDGSLALYASALTLHHANDLPGALVQIRRALKPDGLFTAALLGGDSLNELRHAFLDAESELHGGASPRVAPFADIRDLGSLLQRAGFALPVVDADRLTVRYATALDLMRELRSMGLSSALAQRSRRPMSRRLLLRASEIYHDTFAQADGRVPATFEVIYMSGWAPHASQQQPLKPGSATHRLADALGAREQKI